MSCSLPKLYKTGPRDMVLAQPIGSLDGGGWRVEASVNRINQWVTKRITVGHKDIGPSVWTDTC